MIQLCRQRLACLPVVPPSFPIAGYANAAVWSIPVLRQRGVKAAARKLRWLTHPTFPAKWVPAGSPIHTTSGKIRATARARPYNIPTIYINGNVVLYGRTLAVALVKSCAFVAPLRTG